MSQYRMDWQFYLSKYPDLRRAGICTETQAWMHWVRFGRKERRMASGSPTVGVGGSNKKFLRILLGLGDVLLAAAILIERGLQNQIVLQLSREMLTVYRNGSEDYQHFV